MNTSHNTDPPARGGQDGDKRVEEAEKAWMDLTAQVANELTDFFRMVRPLLSRTDHEELEVPVLDDLLRRRAGCFPGRGSERNEQLTGRTGQPYTPPAPSSTNPSQEVHP